MRCLKAPINNISDEYIFEAPSLRRTGGSFCCSAENQHLSLWLSLSVHISNLCKHEATATYFILENNVKSKQQIEVIGWSHFSPARIKKCASLSQDFTEMSNGLEVSTNIIKTGQTLTVNYGAEGRSGQPVWTLFSDIACVCVWWIIFSQQSEDIFSWFSLQTRLGSVCQSDSQAGKT